MSSIYTSKRSFWQLMPFLGILSSLDQVVCKVKIGFIIQLIIQNMTLVQECLVQALLAECEELVLREEREAKETLLRKIDQIYSLFKQNVRQAFSKFSLDVLVRFTEIAVENPNSFRKGAQLCQLMFERVNATNQFFIRALLVKAKVVAYSAHDKDQKGQQMMVSLKESISFISKALDLIAPQQEAGGKGKDPKAQSSEPSNKGKYAFLIYNASTTLYKVTRFMLRPGWQRNFAEIYERIYKLLEEVQEADHNWRCRFMMVLYQCLYDAERKPDAFKILDTLWEKTKNKPCDFQDSLFRLRCYLTKENNALTAVIKKDIEGADPNGWKILEPLQRMRSGLVPEAQVQKQLMAIVNQISLGVLSNNENVNQPQISSIMQQRLAEAGRVALRFNLVSLANSIVTYLGKTRQPSQRALILNEYNKAELLIKKKGQFIDKNTGMSMSAGQIKQLEIENRKQALRIMEKVMLINKKLNNAELIYQGCIIVWNLALPFMSPQYHSYTVRALDLSISLIQQIDSNDHELRIKLHLQLINIYYQNDLMFSEVERNVFRALRLDPSIPPQKLSIKPEAEEDPSLYTRPYHRYLLEFRQRVLLKTMQIMDPTPLDSVVQDLWTIADHKSQTTKIDTLQKCLKTLLSYEYPPFAVDPEDMLVDEEIKMKRLNYQRQKLRALKRTKMLAAEIAKLSFEWDLNDFAKKASEFVLSDIWQVKNALQLVIAQGHCSLFMAQIKIDELYQANCQPLFEEQQSSELNEEQKKEIKQKKGEVLVFLKKALDYAQSTQQTYLTFNGAICLWNNFLHIFRVNANDAKLRPDLMGLLKDYFQAMKSTLKEIETKGVVYYDLDDRIQTFSNIGLVYARLLQSQKQVPLVEKVCEDLLLTNLSPNTRKLVNGIKARVSGGKAATGGKGADPKKGAAQPQRTVGFNDTFILQINNQLQVIQNIQNKGELQGQIIKCFQVLEGWKPNQQDQIQLELHAELWVKLARLASNQDNSKLLKYSLRCCENALTQSRNSATTVIPPNRLRWYSLAEFLSSGSLLKLVNPKTQEAQSMEVLLFLALNRAVEAAAKGFKCSINVLVVDAAKQLWNVCSHLQENRLHRTKLLKPIGDVLGFLKELKEDSEPDLLLVLSQLYFRSAWENGFHKEGEAVADMMLDILPKGLQRSVWQAKMGFMSKQGKNQLQAISSIKEAEPSLQAKLWVKLARIAPNVSKQQAAYSKALDILKKERSVEIVEVLIEYSEWQLRVGKEPVENVIKNLEYGCNLLIEIEYDHEAEYDQAEDDQTLNSRSRSYNSKKSGASKTIKSSQKDLKKDKKMISVSGKSKPSTVSRMNRSGRGHKTINKNNAKSVFSVKEQDPNPDNLNCIHFERLFRLFTILSSISEEAGKSIGYALNACQQVVSMLKKSISTFNELQENAAKLNQKEEGNKLKIEKIPENIDEWINYEFPKEYIERIDRIDNNNFLGRSTLQKPQLTYCYIQKLINILTNIGLDYETIPLSFFAIYLTRFILKNESYELLQRMKMKRLLARCRHPLQETVKINFMEFRITAEELNQELSHVKSEKASQQADEGTLENWVAPNLIHSLSKYRYWHLAAYQLLEFGEVATAKIYFNQALKCAKVVNDPELIQKIHLGLSECAYLQGQLDEAMRNVSIAHRLCKKVSEWQRIVLNASKVMIEVHRYDSLKCFLVKVMTTVSELIEESTREGKKGSTFKIQMNDLRQLMKAVQISLVTLSFKSYLTETSNQNHQELIKEISSLHSLVKENRNIVWNTLNYEFITNIFQQILACFETKGGKSAIKLSNQVFANMLAILQEEHKINKQLVALINLTQNKGGYYNQIIHIQNRIGFLIVGSLCFKHSYQNCSQGVPLQAQQQQVPQVLKKYYQTANKQIAQHLQPFKPELSSYEKSLTLLNEMEAHISQNSIDYPRLIAMKLFVYSLTRCKDQEVEEQVAAFQQGLEHKLQKFQQDHQCFYYQSKAYQALCQFYSHHQANPHKFYQYASKYQHACSIQSILTFLKKKLAPRHKVLSALRLMDKVSHGTVRQKIVEREKIFNSLTKTINYEECLRMTPKNSLSIIVQLNKLKNRAYFAMINTDSDTTVKKFTAKTHELSQSDVKLYLELQAKISSYQKYLLKTSFEDSTKIQSFINQNQTKLRQIRNTLQDLNSWWLKDVIEMLRTPRANANIANDKDKKGGKDQKKKGGKDELAAFESSLPASPSGIDSIIFFLDDFLHVLPFEELIPTQLVPAVTKDSSIFWSTKKLQEMNYQPELNNSNGFGSDKGKYFSYSFKTEQHNLQEIVAQNGLENIKMEGIEAKKKVPSFGDYTDVFAKPGFLSVYGCVDFLNHMKFSSFFEFIGTNKLRLLIINDNINFPKPTLLKHKDINQQYPSVSLDESEQAFSILSNLLNATIIKSRWLVPPGKMGMYMRDLYGCLAKGQYIGATLRTIRKESDKIGQNWSAYVHGPGVLRL